MLTRMILSSSPYRSATHMITERERERVYKHLTPPVVLLCCTWHHISGYNHVYMWGVASLDYYSSLFHKEIQRFNFVLLYICSSQCNITSHCSSQKLFCVLSKTLHPHRHHVILGQHHMIPKSKKVLEKTLTVSYCCKPTKPHQTEELLTRYPICSSIWNQECSQLYTQYTLMVILQENIDKLVNISEQCIYCVPVSLNRPNNIINKLMIK